MNNLLIPDCTLTTACYCFHNVNPDARTPEESLESMKVLLGVPCYLVIYTDKTMEPLINEERRNHGLTDITKIIIQDFDKIWTAQYREQVVRNRELYWPTRDPRAGVESHLITCNKFDFVLQTMNSNPFSTEKFGWIDANLGKNGSKISSNFSSTKLLYVLNNIGEKFRVQILGVCSKKYKEPEFKREYYETYRFIMCGCLFTLRSNEKNRAILERLRQMFVQTVEQGFGHSEEMLYLEVFDEYFYDIERAYGDYNNILENFIEPTTNYHYIYSFILEKYLKNSYYCEAYYCSKALLEQITNWNVDVDYSLYAKIMFSHYISAFYYKRTEAKEIFERFMKMCALYPKFKEEYTSNKHKYDNTFINL